MIFSGCYYGYFCFCFAFLLLLSLSPFLVFQQIQLIFHYFYFGKTVIFVRAFFQFWLIVSLCFDCFSNWLLFRPCLIDWCQLYFYSPKKVLIYKLSLFQSQAAWALLSKKLSMQIHPWSWGSHQTLHFSKYS